MLHLYPDFLNLYGEYGNVVIIKNQIQKQGIHVNVEQKTKGDDIDFSKYHFIYIGSGTEKHLDFALKDLKRYQESMKNAIENDTVILATGNSYEMFGKKINEEHALDIFDFEVIRLKNRISSSVLYLPADAHFFNNIESEEKESEEPSLQVVGVVNKMTEIYHNMFPLFQVKLGIGENKKNDYEGVKYHSFYGTHVVGPIFAKNPLLTKSFVIEICQKVDANFKYHTSY